MSVLRTSIDPRAETYQANRAAMLALLERMQQHVSEALAGGGPRYVQRHRERGRLLVRERIEMLLDRDSPFLELSPLAAFGTQFQVGASVVTGVGVVEGVECLVSGNDPTVRGGSSNPYTLKKSLRAQDIARENRLPLVNLTESGGADLPTQAEIFVPGGRTFRNLTALSAAGVPTITLVFGSSTAGGAYVPGMSDYSVMIKNQARVFLGGPPLVEMAIGERADEEELGGAEMHSRVSGVSDHFARDEMDAIRIGRAIIGHLNWRKLGPAPSPAAEEPACDQEELLGICPADFRQPFDMREVIARVVDGSYLEEFKPLYGQQLVTGWGRIHGYPVGVIGNNGILFSEESQKAAQFIQLCNLHNTSIVFLQNITGYMVGTKAEQGGIIKHGAQMINAVSNSTVPHFTIMVGASYGAGNYGMAGRAYDPRFVFTWPNHRIAVMGGKQLAGVMSIVQRQAAAARGEPYDEEKDAIARKMLEEKIEQESDAFYATAHLWDDGIIDPRDTRTVLGLAISAAHNNVVEGARHYGVFRM